MMLQINQKYCTNCGKLGHLYKQCKYPVISLGVILFKITNNELKILLVQRKHTLSYVEFIRGKYDLTSLIKLNNLLPKMTYDEINNLQVKTFDELWLELWNIDNLEMLDNRYKKEYKYSKNNFLVIKNGYLLNNKFINIENLIKNISKYYNEPEWGFPKGRRNYKENNLNCALREFSEETGYSKHDIILLDEFPLKEKFKGSNGINYEHIYYLAISKKDDNPILDKNNIEQMKEINDIKWLNFEEAYNAIRPYNIEKKNILQQSVHIILNKIKN